MKPVFTPAQIAAFIAYEEVRSEGAFNMLSREAQEMTGLGRREYLFVMENYSALKAAAAGGSE